MCVFHIAVVLMRNLLGILISMEPLVGWYSIDARADREPGKGPRAGKSRTPEHQGSLGTTGTGDKHSHRHSQLVFAFPSTHSLFLCCLQGDGTHRRSPYSLKHQKHTITSVINLPIYKKVKSA